MKAEILPKKKDRIETAEELSIPRRVFIFSIMCIGFFIAMLDIQIVSASLKDIGGGLSAGPDETAWVQTSYLIAEIIVIPLSGWLSRVLSTRWLFCFSAIGFTAASLLCGMAWDLRSMIIFRAMQGFLGGSMIPTVFTTAFFYFKGHLRVIAAAVVGALASLAPTMGPTLGGWITDHYSWHWLFFVNLVPGIVVSVLVPIMVRIDKVDFSLLRGADYIGMALMAAFLGCLEYTLEEGPRWNWFQDRTILTTAWICGLSAVAFVWRELTFGNPVVDLRALKNRNFALGCLFSFVGGIGIFSTIFLTPMFLGHVRGYSALQIGESIFSTGVFQLLAIPIYVWCAKRYELRWLLMFGFACFTVGIWEFTPITHDWGWKELLIPQAIRGFAQQFTVAPVVTLTLGELSPLLLRSASGLFNLTRNLGGAIGIAICGTLLNDRANLHFYRLAEHMNGANSQANLAVEKIGTRFASYSGGDIVHGHAFAIKKLWGLAWREAQVQTFSDAFLVIALCMGITTLLVPLLRKVVAQAGAVSESH
ncbi:MAG: EmrB/QacA family drug resistance transporter [Verrucomicrobiales bacterium]|nr:EmrB/QacA family drug resistance transporter [Verrucomicrobiales bacterium]